MRGRFITFEGGEGTGKSTHAVLLADRLKSLGIGVVLTREPGGSPGAEAIRHVLLSGVAKPLDFMPADYEKRLVKNDFAWSAKYRERIIAEWIKRYDGKSEPK